jgi:hypothetical protein
LEIFGNLQPSSLDEMQQHDFDMIYCLLRADIVAAKNLMFIVIFYVVFFNYYFKNYRGRVAAKIRIR